MQLQQAAWPWSCHQAFITATIPSQAPVFDRLQYAKHKGEGRARISHQEWSLGRQVLLFVASFIKNACLNKKHSFIWRPLFPHSVYINMTKLVRKREGDCLKLNSAHCNQPKTWAWESLEAMLVYLYDYMLTKVLSWPLSRCSPVTNCSGTFFSYSMNKQCLVNFNNLSKSVSVNSSKLKIYSKSISVNSSKL